MKGDITRNTFKPEKHYSSVRMQQGRVQLDADWNEQHDIWAHRSRTTCKDIIGPCGVPRTGGGFEISAIGEEGNLDLVISPGRIYVDGILCELEATPVPIEAVEGTLSQVTVPTLTVDGRQFEAGQWVEIFAHDGGVETIRTRITSVEADVRRLTLQTEVGNFLQEATAPQLRRLTTFFKQLDYLPALDGVESLAALADGVHLVYLDVWERHISALEDREIREKALGGPDTATRTQVIWQVKLFAVPESEVQPVTCREALLHLQTSIQSSGSLLRCRAQPGEETTEPCVVPPGAGFIGLENQLYRVEIHEGGALDQATFKWSRDNASVQAAIEVSIDEQPTNRVRVKSLGKDELLALEGGQWVEVLDDATELSGQPGILAQIEAIDPAERIVTLSEEVSRLDPVGYPKVRRWDMPEGPITVETPDTNDGFLHLERGIQIKFEGGPFKSGDYWQVPARTATGDVEWPRDGANGGEPLPQPPHGIEHHYCPLALLRLEGGEIELTEDCRQLFPRLIDLQPTTVPEPVIRIRAVESPDSRIPVLNDTLVSTSRLAEGLRVVCDAEIAPEAFQAAPGQLPAPANPNCQVILALPYPDRTAAAFWGISTIFGWSPLMLDGVVNAEGHEILWTPTDATSRWLEGSLFQRLVDGAGNAIVDRLLVSFNLEGNFIWGADRPEVYLDGDVFGRPGPGRVDLRLPSGDGRRGGDFKTWFWLVPNLVLEATVNLNIVSGVVRNDSGQLIPGATVTLSGPGVNVTTITDADGQFRFPGVLPGDYSVAAESAGSSVQADVQVGPVLVSPSPGGGGSVNRIEGIGRGRRTRLEANGITRVDEVAAMEAARLAEILEISEARAANFIARARQLLTP